MAQFLKKLGVFIIPLLTLFSFVEYRLQTIPNEYSTKFENFDSKLGEIEVLVLGSSHALRGINPHSFTDRNVYNMAMVSQPLQIDHDILFNYRDKMPNLKTVIFSISHFSLSAEINEGEIVNRLPFYHFFYKLEFDQLSPFDIEYHSLQAALGYRNSFSTIIKNIYGEKKEIKTDSLGWMGTGGVYCDSEEEFKRNALEAVSRHEDGSYDFSTNLRLLQNIIEWANDNQVQLIFVNTPKTVWYNNLLNEDKSKLIDSIMMGLTFESDNIRYLNLKNHPEFKQSDFRNSDHLNLNGAKKLTKLLNDYIK